MNEIAKIAAAAAVDEGPAPDALKVFISYSRADLATADQMVAALKRNGFDVKIDVRDLPYGEEWQGELADFIAGSDTVVWLVSPDSIRSRWVNWELGEVGRLSKRLVPVRVRAVEAEELPEALGKVNLLPNRGIYDPDVDEAALVATLNTNRGWLKKGTALSDDAREWINGDRNNSHLLRGRALTNAEAWARQPPRDAPSPPSDVLELILASQRAQQRRRRIGVGLAVSVAAVLAGAGWFVQMQARDALAQREVARATAAQRQNEIARKLLEGETQIGTAIVGLAPASLDEAPVMDRIQAAWAERLVPVREAIRTEKPQLWQIAGKQVLTVGERMETYPDGVVIGFAAVSDDTFVLIDSVGRLVVLDGEGKVRDISNDDGEPTANPSADDIVNGTTTFGELSRLKLFKVGSDAVAAVGTTSASTAGGESPTFLYIDARHGILYSGSLYFGYRGASTTIGGDDSCPGWTAVPTDELTALEALYSERSLASPFTTLRSNLAEDLPANTSALCLLGEYSSSGELSNIVSTGLSFEFVAPVGKVLTLPVLEPENSLWELVTNKSVWRDEWADEGGRGIDALQGGYSIEFLSVEDFYQDAKFRGGREADLSFARPVVEEKRYGDSEYTQRHELKLFKRGGSKIMVAVFYDKFAMPEICWFDASYVVEACEALGFIYDSGGGLFISADGAYVVAASQEILGGRSLRLVDIDRRKVVVPQQRTGGTILEVFAQNERLLAIDNRGVVWTYAFPTMELISSFDMKWPTSVERPLSIGGRHLDLSSRGVVRLLDVRSQDTAWISTPFPGGATISGLAVSSDESVVMAVDASGSVRVLDTKTGIPLTSVFKPEGTCTSVEHDQSILELSCGDLYLQRQLPISIAAEGPVDVGSYALDSQEAAGAFFVGVPAFDLGIALSSKTETDVTPIEGTVEEFEAANVKVEEPDEPAKPEIAPVTELGWPVDAPIAGRFGLGGRDGVNFIVDENTPVKAAEDGVIIYAGDGLSEFGNTALLRHRDGLVTIYAHLSQLNVERGSQVARGQIIGLSGMTGTATDRPKLHFEVRRDSAPVDPEGFLPIVSQAKP